MKITSGYLLYLFPAFAAVCLCLLAYSYLIEPNRLVINQQNIKVRRLDSALDGLKIVAISDIHGGSNGVTEDKLRRIVEQANAQEPDLIVLLGDFVSQYDGKDGMGLRPLRMPIDTIAKGLSGFKTKLGVFAVLGNHDGWYDDWTVADRLTQNGIRVLQNELAIVQHNGKVLRILGLKDHMRIKTWDSFAADAKRVIDQSSVKSDIIVLEHSPDVLPIITGQRSISPDIRLFLAGHTHGGQVWLPILGTPIVPSSYGQKYSYGHIRQDEVDMFVTTGVGTSILPFRFMMPPEVAVLTLQSE
ncbi:MAG: metallophosphoesterase [Acidobacteria bacterium]|nr:metallophosphoesterase [Acidobacteriota bacterium]